MLMESTSGKRSSTEATQASMGEKIVHDPGLANPRKACRVDP